MNRRERVLKKKKKIRRRKKIIRITICILLVILFFVAIVGGAIWYKLESVNRRKIKPNISNENKQVEQGHKENGIDLINIALFGLDSRDVKGNDDPRSDAIMVVTVDKGRGKIKLSSIIRDSYVEIPGRKGKDKINHAYHFGGPELAVDTINHNFGLTIQDYAAINFYGLRKVIDTLGGLDIEITSDELKNLNEHIKDCAKHEGIKPTYVKKTGMQHLNGLQSTAYCRIRYANGGDYKRAERQRVVFSKILKKISALEKSKYPKLISDLLPCIETSLSSSEILGLGMDVMSLDLGKIEQQQFPTSWQGEGEEINKIDYFVADLDDVKKSMLKYIYEDVKPKNPDDTKDKEETKTTKETKATKK